MFSIITAIPYSRKGKLIFWSKRLIEEFVEYCWIELLYFLKQYTYRLSEIMFDQRCGSITHSKPLKRHRNSLNLDTIYSQYESTDKSKNSQNQTAKERLKLITYHSNNVSTNI